MPTASPETARTISSHGSEPGTRCSALATTNTARPYTITCRRPWRAAIGANNSDPMAEPAAAAATSNLPPASSTPSACRTNGNSAPSTLVFRFRANAAIASAAIARRSRGDGCGPIADEGAGAGGAGDDTGPGSCKAPRRKSPSRRRFRPLRSARNFRRHGAGIEFLASCSD